MNNTVTDPDLLHVLKSFKNIEFVSGELVKKNCWTRWLILMTTKPEQNNMKNVREELLSDPRTPVQARLLNFIVV